MRKIAVWSLFLYHRIIVNATGKKPVASIFYKKLLQQHPDTAIDARVISQLGQGEFYILEAAGIDNPVDDQGRHRLTPYSSAVIRMSLLRTSAESRT